MPKLDTRKIAAKSQLLHERIEDGHGNWDCTSSSEPSEERIEYSEYLEEVYDSEIRTYASFPTWPPDEDLPSWMDTFLALTSHLSDDTVHNSRIAETEYGVPFEDILVHFLDHCSQQVDPNIANVLTASAREDLEAHFMERVRKVVDQALHLEFIQYIHEQSDDTVSDETLSSESTFWYDRFVSYFLDGGYAEFFETYPVIPRLIATLTDQWVIQVEQLVSRLQNDRAEIRRLTGSEVLGRVSRIETDAGDPHDHGSTVMIVTFENGEGIVYKPREMDAEEGLYELISWVSSKLDDRFEIRCPDIVSRPSYGWIQKVSHGNFDSTSDLESYYENTGALICILYITNTTDCHPENVIASDDSPTIIDAETTLQAGRPVTDVDDSRLETKLRQYTVNSSVLNTVLLSHSSASSSASTGGLEHQENEATAPRATWMNTNTDAMDIEYRDQSLSTENNVPRYRGEPVSPDLYIECIIEGFRAAYTAILESREEAIERIHDVFSGVTVRSLLDQTEIYNALLSTLTNPEYLKDGMYYSYKIEHTLRLKASRPVFENNEGMIEDLIKAETESIVNRDVPKFTRKTDGSTILHRDNVVCENYTMITGIDTVIRRISGMTREDMNRQEGLIRASLAGPRYT